MAQGRGGGGMAGTAAEAGQDAAEPAVGRRDRLVVGAASVGTVFEWYDFYL